MCIKEKYNPCAATTCLIGYKCVPKVSSRGICMAGGKAAAQMLRIGDVDQPIASCIFARCRAARASV